MKQINGNAMSKHTFLLDCYVGWSALVSFIVKSLEIGAWLKSTCVLNAENCACHLSDGIYREAMHLESWGERDRAMKAYAQNIYRLFSYLMHEESSAIPCYYLCGCVRMPNRSPEICLAQMQTLKLPLPIENGSVRKHTRTLIYRMRPLNKHTNNPKTKSQLNKC